MFMLKYVSLLDFEKQTTSAKENLKHLFGITQFSSDSCLRKVLDKVEWQALRQLLIKKFYQLKDAGLVDNYRYLDNHILVTIDGVEHFSSKKVHCPQCLTKQHKTGEITYFTFDALCGGRTSCSITGICDRNRANTTPGWLPEE